jgi:hypothetical protein
MPASPSSDMHKRRSCYKGHAQALQVTSSRLSRRSRLYVTSCPRYPGPCPEHARASSVTAASTQTAWMPCHARHPPLAVVHYKRRPHARHALLPATGGTPRPPRAGHAGFACACLPRLHMACVSSGPVSSPPAAAQPEAYTDKAAVQRPAVCCSAVASVDQPRLPFVSGRCTTCRFVACALGRRVSDKARAVQCDEPPSPQGAGAHALPTTICRQARPGRARPRPQAPTEAQGYSKPATRCKSGPCAWRQAACMLARVVGGWRGKAARASGSVVSRARSSGASGMARSVSSFCSVTHTCAHARSLAARAPASSASPAPAAPGAPATVQGQREPERARRGKASRAGVAPAARGNAQARPTSVGEVGP